MKVTTQEGYYKVTIPVFPDLSPYLSFTPKIVRVGWIETGAPRCDSSVDATTLAMLRQITGGLDHAARFRGHELQSAMRCPLCSRHIQLTSSDGADVQLGTCEIWFPNVLDPTVTFVAPDFLTHFMTDHGYRPPSIALQSITGVELDSDFDATEISHQILLMDEYDQADRDEIRRSLMGFGE